MDQAQREHRRAGNHYFLLGLALGALAPVMGFALAAAFPWIWPGDPMIGLLGAWIGVGVVLLAAAGCLFAAVVLWITE